MISSDYIMTRWLLMTIKTMTTIILMMRKSGSPYLYVCHIERKVRKKKKLSYTGLKYDRDNDDDA